MRCLSPTWLLPTFALMLAACGQDAPTPGPGPSEDIAGLQPAFWTLSDEDTTVHLFGTVHTLKPGTDWKTIGFTTAFEASDALFIEADLETPSVINRVQSVVAQQAVFSDGTQLDDYLEDDEEILVDQAISLVGLEPDDAQNLRPWLLSQSLTDLYAEKQGYNSDLGVESILIRDARRSGKEIEYLESAAELLGRLGGLPDTATADLLVATAEDIMQRPEALDQLVAMWGAADVSGLSNVFRQDGAFGAPVVYDLLITERNQDWAEQIVELMESREGTYMIAVGAGHLAGPDRLQFLLEAEGYSVLQQ